jgi:Domain of unknown function (DUF4380)
MADMGNCSIEHADFRGWKAIFLRNGIITVVAVPDIGGRIMAFDLAETPLFFVDPSLTGKLFSQQENQGDGSLGAWKNYGGDKTWPSPQGWDNEDQWHGPPDPVLDTGRYRVSGMEHSARSASLQMVSPPDSRTGIEITRKATLHQGSSRVELELSFKNISDRPRRWSIWDVAQLQAERTLADGKLAPDTSCTVTAPLNPKSKFPDGYWVMFGEPSNPQWSVNREHGLVMAKYQWEIGKIGSDACSPDMHSGWIAFSNPSRGLAFAERFPVFPGEEYPDSGSTVECWTIGKGRVANLDYERSEIYLMETEVLSPFYTFQPGARHAFKIDWGACRSSGPVLDVRAGGCTSQKLVAQSTGEGVRLSGVFGAFDYGNLLLTWLDRAGEASGSILLESVQPDQLIEFDQTFRRPPGASAVELSVLSEADGELRELGKCELM